MATIFKLISDHRTLAGRFLIIDTPGVGAQQWAHTRVRRLYTCQMCQGKISFGGRAFRPVTNGRNRTDRLCSRCVEDTMPRLAAGKKS